MKRFLAAFTLAFLVVAPAVWAAGPVRLYLSRVVRCTNAAGGAALFSSGVRRAQVRVQNLGNATAWVGQQDGTLTTATGWPLHAASQIQQSHALTLANTSAGLNCVTDSTNSVLIGVLEEIE